MEGEDNVEDRNRNNRPRPVSQRPSAYPSQGYGSPQQPRGYSQNPQQPRGYSQNPQQPRGYSQQPQQPRGYSQRGTGYSQYGQQPRQQAGNNQQPRPLTGNSQHLRPQAGNSQHPRPTVSNVKQWYEEQPMPFMTENIKMSEVDNSKQKPVKLKKVADYTIWVLMMASAVALLYFIYNMNMISMKYLMAGSGALVLFVLLFLVGIICRKKKSWRMWVSRTVMTATSIAMAFGSFTIFNGMRVLDSMTNSDSLMRVSLATSLKAESAPKSVKELSGKGVGYSTASDKNAVCYAMSKLTEAQSDVKFVAYKDYKALCKALEDGEIASAIIPNAREETLKSEVENYKDMEYMTTYTSIRNVKDKTVAPVEVETGEPFVVYLAGLGEAGDATVDELTDVNILAFVNPEKRQITTVSIPRDSFVPNPALNMGSDKLTHLGMDGVYNSMQGLENTFGIEIDYYARVSFTSIIELVDAVGGVTVDVEIPFTEQDENRSFAYNDLITLKAGKQKLNGKQALAYARHRKSYADGTAGRERAQQKIIKAMVTQLCTAQGIANINNVLNVAEKYVSTDIPMPLIQGIIKQETEDMKPWKVNSMTLEGVYNSQMTTVSMPSLKLSCQYLSQRDLDMVYTLYNANLGEDEGMTLDNLLKSYNEHVKLNKQNIEQGLDEDMSFFETLQSPPANDYIVTYEESYMINPDAPVYGWENIASQEEPDVNTRLRLVLPKISTGYYV